MEAIVRTFILLGFSVFFFGIVMSNQVLLYVHPRLIPYIIFGIIAMMIISIFTISDVFKPKKKVNLSVYIFFIVPLFLAVSLPAKAMDSTSLSYGDIKFAQQSETDTDNQAIDTNSVDDTYTDSASSADINNTDSVSSTAQSEDTSSDSGLTMQGNTIIMDSDNFGIWLNEITDNMDKYNGKKIELTGFVYKDKQFKANEFVPARLMMTCCTADLQPVGLLCRYAGTPQLKQDSWIKVSGTISVENDNNEKTAVIIPDSITNTAKPAEEYVYPY